jgi:uncharacterized membrane-anchored protein YjiN (DUF445 family)
MTTLYTNSAYIKMIMLKAELLRYIPGLADIEDLIDPEFDEHINTVVNTMSEVDQETLHQQIEDRKPDVAQLIRIAGQIVQHF